MLRATHKKGCNRLSLANTIRQIAVEVQRSEERNPTPEKNFCTMLTEVLTKNEESRNNIIIVPLS